MKNNIFESVDQTIERIKGDNDSRYDSENFPAGFDPELAEASDKNRLPISY